jgi:hypothetical protein
MMKTKKTTMVATLVFLGLGAGATMAGTPFGGDDMGTISSSKTVNKCEGKVSKAAGKLVSAIIKCHAGRASGKFANDAAENACETTAKTKFLATKLAGCAPCLNAGTLAALATGIEAAVDSNNSEVACDPTGIPAGGDDTGFIPSDAPKGPETKCELGVGKGVGKLVGAIIKCHISRAGGKLADDAAENTCEGAAITKFKATKTTGCPSCVNLSTIATTTETASDGALNGLIWCGSPSGAFLTN